MASRAVRALHPASCILHLVACLLLWLLFAQAVRGAATASLTFDEGLHLTGGYTILRTGDLRLQPAVMHPPLLNMLSAAPARLDSSLPDPRTIDGWDIASLSAMVDTIVWQYRPPGRLALAGRVPVILLAVLLGAFVYRWATDLAGPKAGLLALCLYALDPNIIAHAQAITTDMGMTALGFMTLYGYFKFQILRLRSGQVSDLKSRARWLVVTGMMSGMALATKVSAGLLAPLLAAIELLAGRGSFKRRIGRIAIVGLIAFGVLWAVYGFEIGRVPGLPFPVPAATHVKIYQTLQQHYYEGHPAFLMGMNSKHGWWYYFPVAFLVKTPLPTLILLGLGIGYWILEIRHRRLKARNGKWVLMLFPIVHFSTALLSSVNIGYRHLLPILPFIFVCIGVQISNPSAPLRTGFRFQISDFRFQTRSPCPPVSLSPCPPVPLSPCPLVPSSPCLLIFALLIWYAVGAAAIFPHHLAYFNELAGGPDNGYKWLVDSNLDWGQNLWELRDWMQANNVDKVYYAHYSPARPEVYGVQAEFLPPDPRAIPFTSWSPAPGIYAIGATVLQGAYLSDVNTYAWFRHQKPVARIGHALFIYRVEPLPANTPSPGWAAVCAAPLPIILPEEARAYLSRSDLRVVLMNCHQSWVYPADDKPGVYILPTGAMPPPDATLELETRQANGKPFYQVYRIEKKLAPGESVNGLPVWAMHDITLDGPLALAGYWVNRAGAYPGETVELWTLWQVNQVPNRPLSLMAHLVGANGIPIAVGDGSGVPMEHWRPGDTLIQRHILRVPLGTRSQACSIQTGAYWLDTMERWPVRSKEGTISDQLELTTITILN